MSTSALTTNSQTIYDDKPRMKPEHQADRNTAMNKETIIYGLKCNSL